MSLTLKAQQDAQQITTNSSDWGVEVVFVAPTAETVTVNALHVKHNTGFDLDGVRVNAKISSIAVSELELVSLNYPIRNGSDEISLKNHRISVADSSTVVREYLVSETYPDEKLGLIVLILKDFE